MKKISLILLLILFSQSLYANLDSLYYQNLDSLYHLKLERIKNRIDSLSLLTNNSYQLSELNNQILKQIHSNRTFLDIPIVAILISLTVGLLASILTLMGNKLIYERNLKKKFKYLEGKYIHVGNNIRPNSYSNISYKKGGKLVIDTKTDYGVWKGRIVMDKDMPEYGGGLFNYEDRQEGGLIQMIIRDKNNIYVFPSTLTHEFQRLNFYIMRRET